MILEYAPNNALYFVIDVPFVDNSTFTDDIDMSRTGYILSSCQFESFYMYYGAPYYTISDHVAYDKLITDDTLLFTKKVDSIFLDSIRIVKNLGVTSFRTADGRRFHLDQ